MLLLTGVAGLVFVWGLVEFLWALRKGDNPKKGQDHMIWGLIGLFIMVASWAIIQVIQRTVIGLLS